MLPPPWRLNQDSLKTMVGGSPLLETASNLSVKRRKAWTAMGRSSRLRRQNFGTVKVPINALRVNEFPHKIGQLIASSHSSVRSMNGNRSPTGNRARTDPLEWLPLTERKRGAARYRAAPLEKPSLRAAKGTQCSSPYWRV